MLNRICPPALVILLAFNGLQQVDARSPYKEVVPFSYSTNVGFSRSLYVVGNHFDVGNWNPTGAVRLFWTSGNVWTGNIAVQAGTALEYKFIARINSPATAGDTNNLEWMPGANLTTNIPVQPSAPYSGKTFYYHSGWTSAAVVYRTGTNWYDAAMTRDGAGRNGSEYRYKISGIGEAGEELEFIPHGWWTNGTEYWDHAPYGGYGISNYYTTLDVFFLQDGNIYNYWPPASVSGSQIESRYIVSDWQTNIPSRDVRIYLPRGYNENTNRYYPVLYMHDGQNVFYPGGDWGCWNADSIADKEISQGRMREAIIVAVDCTDRRNYEYSPPCDNYEGTGQGTGDKYASFLVHNVRPTIDTHYRTLNDRANTLTAGSSMGGLISTYLGLGTNVFGKIGAFSPAFLVAPNFVDWIESNNTKGTRIYMDDGTVGLETDLWQTVWQTYDLFLADRYAVNDDLLMVVGFGQEHNEAAWASRLPTAYHFLLNLNDEENLLARNTYPPVISNAVLSVMGETVRVTTTTLKAQQVHLERTTNLLSGSWIGMSSLTETNPWAIRTLTDTNPAPVAAWYYRLRVE